MTVQYTRKRVKMTKRVEMEGDDAEGAVEEHERLCALGYTRMLFVGHDAGWSAAYERVEVVGDTARGDEVEL